jgi:hypothetical protein
MCGGSGHISLSVISLFWHVMPCSNHQAQWRQSFRAVEHFLPWLQVWHSLQTYLQKLDTFFTHGSFQWIGTHINFTFLQLVPKKINVVTKLQWRPTWYRQSCEAVNPNKSSKVQKGWQYCNRGLLVGEVYCWSSGGGMLVSSRRIRFMIVNLKPNSFTLLRTGYSRGII